MTLKTQVQCRRVGDCLQVVADVKHIPARSAGESVKPRYPHHDHFPLRSARFCDVSRADPNFEELSQSTVIAFMDAITACSGASGGAASTQAPCIHRSAYPTSR